MQALIAHKAAAMSAKRAYLLIIDCASSELSNWINSSKQWQVVQDSWIWRTYWILLACDTSLPLIAFTDVARPSLLSTQSTSREGLKDFFKFLSHEVFMKFLWSFFMVLFPALWRQVTAGLALCVSGIRNCILVGQEKKFCLTASHRVAQEVRWTFSALLRVHQAALDHNDHIYDTTLVSSHALNLSEKWNEKCLYAGFEDVATLLCFSYLRLENCTWWLRHFLPWQGHTWLPHDIL